MASVVSRVIDTARAELGKPYVYGAEGPAAFDCSGLIQFVFAAAGLKLPRTAAQQQAATTRVTTPAPGDLVFYGAPAHHVGLYVGDGQMIAAPHAGDVVKVQAVYGTPTYGRVNGAGTATAPVVDAVATGLTAGSSSTGWTGTARNLGVELAVVAAAGALVIAGLARALSPTVRRQIQGATS